MRMIYAEKDSESIVCMSIAEFVEYRREGYSGTEEVNRQADELIAKTSYAESVLATCNKYGICPMEALELMRQSHSQ